MGRYFLVFLFLLTGAWTTVALAEQSTPAPQRIYTVAFAQDTLGNDWRLSQVRSLEQELERYPFIRFIYTNAEGQTARQIMDIEELIASGIDLLVTSPRDSKALTPVISNSYRQGIPVVLLTRDIANDDYNTLIGADDMAIAAKAARLMAKQLMGQGKILMLQGVPTTTTAIARTEGFLSTIKEFPELEVVAIKAANYLRSDAIRAIEEALAEGIEFNAIYAQSDSMASGARMALHRAGIEPSSIFTVGIDYISEAREAIRNGEQYASFVYPTAGKEAAEYIVKLLRGEQVPKRVVIDSVVVTRENVEAVEPIF